MKTIFALFASLVIASGASVNITNYPLTNDFGANELFLLSSIPQKTNFNLPGNYVAKAADLTTVSNLARAAGGGVTTNVFVAAGANITVSEVNSSTNRTYTISGGSYQNISNIFAGTVDVRDYGAVADCVQLTNATMTVGTTTLESSMAAFKDPDDIGKHVVVVDGMAAGVNLGETIVSVNSSTSVELSGTCSNTPTGQVFYGTDNSEAFQLAVNAATTNELGGAVYVENGTYLLDGDWRSNPGTAVAGSSKCQISLPPYRPISGTNMAIRLFGNTPGAVMGFPRTPNSLEIAGAVLVCAKTAYDTTNYTIIGAPTSYPDFTFNYVRVILENLTFRTQRDGRLCPVNLKYVSTVKLENVHVDVGTTGECLTNTAPRYASYGVIFPGVNNDIQSWVNNVRVAGFGIGMLLGECASYDQLTSIQCVTGFELQTMWHGLHVNYGYAINCATGIVVNPCSSTLPIPPNLQIHWSLFETEDNNSGGWDDMYYDVYDPNSYLYGDIYFSSAGLASTRVPKCYGATNVTLHLPGQGVYNNFYSFGKLDTTNRISLYLGSTRAGAAIAESDGVTYANATLTVDRATGDTLLNAKSGAIKFYRAQAGNPIASVTTNGFVGNLTIQSNSATPPVVTAPDVRFWNSNGLSVWIISATATNYIGGTPP